MREFMNISESPSDIKISHYTNKILVKEMLFELIFTRKETKTRFKIFSSKNTFLRLKILHIMSGHLTRAIPPIYDRKFDLPRYKSITG